MSSFANSFGIKIRKAVREDCYDIMRLKKELAEHQNMGSFHILSPEELERDGFDTTPPLFHCIVAEVTENSILVHKNNEAKEKKIVVGYALYFDAYPIWEGREIGLEDLCVSKNWRKLGIGKLLMKELARIGVEENYSRISLECLNSNTSLNFYKKIYGVDKSEEEGWKVLRFDNEALLKLAEKED